MGACPQIDNFDINYVIIVGPQVSVENPGRNNRAGSERLRSNFEHHDMDAPNLDIARDRRGLHRPNPDRSDRLFSEDDASMSVEDDGSMSC